MENMFKDEILSFSYDPLVDDIYHGLNEESYLENYNHVKSKNNTNINKKLTQFRIYKTKVAIVVMMILNFINNLFVRMCGYIVITSILGLIHSFVHAKSFLYICQIGQDIYDKWLQNLFILTSKEILIEGSKGMVSQSVDSPLSQSSSYLLFYIIIGTLILLSIWFVEFVYKMIETEEVKFEEKEMSLDEAIRKLGCNEFDDLSYIKKQLNKKYLKNQIYRRNQLIYIQSYITIIKNKDFNIFNEEINDNDKKKLLKKMLITGSIYFLNLISKAICISGIIILIYYRFMDAFVNRGYLKELWSFFKGVHHIVQGGIIAWFSAYKQASEHVQITLSVAFVVFCLVILFQGYSLFVVRVKRLKVNYTHYLILSNKEESYKKFSDSYSIHWFVFLIIVCFFGIVILILQ